MPWSGAKKRLTKSTPSSLPIGGDDKVTARRLDAPAKLGIAARTEATSAEAREIGIIDGADHDLDRLLSDGFGDATGNRRILIGLETQNREIQFQALAIDHATCKGPERLSKRIC